jgi:transcriptional regulator with XRE-family HTH domain
MSSKIYKLLGKNIKKRRMELGYTQQELADKIGKGLNFVGKIEVAFSKPSFDTIIDISEALNIELKDLFDFDELD